MAPRVLQALPASPVSSSARRYGAPSVAAGERNYLPFIDRIMVSQAHPAEGNAMTEVVVHVLFVVRPDTTESQVLPYTRQLIVSAGPLFVATRVVCRLSAARRLKNRLSAQK